MLFIIFPILSYQVFHMPKVLDIPTHMSICQEKPLKFTINLYTDHKYLWVKHTTHPKAESLRAGSLSVLDNIVNNNPIFNVKCDEFSTNWYEFFNLLLHVTTPTISIKNPFLYFSKFSPLYSLLHVHKTIFMIPINTPFPYSSAIFISLFFRTAIPAISTQKAFSLHQPWKSLKS